MNHNKIFRTLDEQIDILKSKGLIINNVDKTKNILFKENYFFLSGYRHLFTKSFGDNNYIKGTTFEELYAMFVFDRHLRNVMFKNILIIENNIKSTMSYILSKKYGYQDRDYLNPKNFNNDPIKGRQVKDVLNKMKRQIRVNGKEHTATYHYINNYGYVPMWILVKVLSFGIISELFSILKVEDQTKIANVYNLDVETLSIYLSLLANFRNVCAHEDILYMHRTQRVIPDSKYHYLLNIDMTDDDYIYGKDDVFALIIIMKFMLSDVEFRELFNEVSYEIDILSSKIKVVSIEDILSKIGFPETWRDILTVS